MEHTSAIFAQRLIGHLAFLYEVISMSTEDFKESAYKGLVRPVLKYGTSVWDAQVYFIKSY